MNREEFSAWEDRIRLRADQLWEAAGKPEGERDRFLEDARELVAIEEVEIPKLDPEEAAAPVVEEASIQRNLGEFPTLRDQGDEQTYPDTPDHGDIHLSDGDASETGGVLPIEDLPDEDLRDVSMADADITTSAVDADDEPQTGDLNDDGMPDPTDLDVEGEMDEENEYEDAATGNDDDEAGYSRSDPAR